MNQVNQHIPFVRGENREIAGLTDPDVFASELHLRALPTPWMKPKPSPLGQGQEFFSVGVHAHKATLRKRRASPITGTDSIHPQPCQAARFARLQCSWR